MISCELITKKVKINNKQVKSRFFNLDTDLACLCFCDNLSQETYTFCDKISNQDISVVVVTPDIATSYKNPKVKIIQTQPKWFIHSLFNSPHSFKMVSYNGEKSKKLAFAFYQYTGFKVDIVSSVNEALKIKSAGQNNLLIRPPDGIGDVLMILPVLKKLSETYKIDLLVNKAKLDCLTNVPYINNVYTTPKDIKLSNYESYYDLCYTTSHYGNKVCQQHRIKTMAEILRLNPKDFESAKPEINLSKQEIINFKNSFPKINKSIKNKLVVSFEGNDIRRTYPVELREKLLKELIRHFTVYVVGKYTKVYHYGNNYTGKLTIRQLFVLVYLADYLLSVDSGVLHVGAAFTKKTVFLPSVVPGDWRSYRGVITIKPEIECYSCREQCKYNYPKCLISIPQERIIAELLKLKEKE